MKLIYPYVEHWLEHDHVNHVAKCARVCYASETDSEMSNLKLYHSLENKKHTSMLRHESRYFVITKQEVGDKEFKNIYNEFRNYKYCPYIEWKCVNSVIYAVTNGDFYKNSAYAKLIGLIKMHEIDRSEFRKLYDAKGMLRHTFCIVTQISTSRELNRTSPNNIAEQSTRYVDFAKKGDITICLPHWWDTVTWFERFIHKTYWKSCELLYKFLLWLGFLPQDARGVLPLDTATKVVYTYSEKEWKHIIDLRFNETTGKAHPNAKCVIKQVYQYLVDFGFNK